MFPDEELRFVVTVHSEEDIHELQVEVWTDVSCEENQKHGEEYAIPLHFERRDGEYYIFSRSITPDHPGFYNFSVRYRSAKRGRWTWVGQGTLYEQRTNTPLYVEPGWVRNTVVYNAFVRQFGATDSDGDGIIRPGEGGTFADLINRMDHFTKMGIGAIYLNPIQLAGESFLYRDEITVHYQDETNHLPIHMHPGSVYSIKDYRSIDPELGLNEDDFQTDQYLEFRRFVKECHDRGIRVILDVVFDHTAKDSLMQRLHPEWFLYRKDPNSLDSEFVHPGDADAEEYWGKPEFLASPYDHGIFWSDCSFINWNFRYPPGPNTPPANTRIVEMREYFKNVLKYWIKQFGVDGFRLDVAYAIPPDFWHEALADIRDFAEGVIWAHEEDSVDQRLAPLSSDIVFIGETYVDDVYELQECGVTMLNGDFSSKIFSVEQLKGYLDYAYNLSGDFFPMNSRWLLFPECHDFERLPMKFKDMLHSENADKQLNKSRWTLAATLPGTPMLHNGYEMVEHENVSVRSYSGINWDSSKNIIDHIAQVNAVRNESKALQEGRYVFVDTEQGTGHGAQIFSFIRDYDKNGVRETMLVVVNMDINNTADHIQVRLPVLYGYDFTKKYRIKDLLSGLEGSREGPELTVVLPPGESHLFLLSQ